MLRHNKRKVGQIRPQVNTLLYFQGDLTHSVNALTSPGTRLSLVCEQYNLMETELQEIPEFTLESRANKSQVKGSKQGGISSSRY